MGFGLAVCDCVSASGATAGFQIEYVKSAEDQKWLLEVPLRMRAAQ